MTQLDYLRNLLSLCTDEQKRLFNLMYPDGVDGASFKTALYQCENTLKKQNNRCSTLSDENKQLSERLHKLSVYCKKLVSEEIELKNKLDALEVKLSSLYFNNPNIKEIEDLKEDSRFLQALLSAGVDNWDGYDMAIDEMNEDN